MPFENVSSATPSVNSGDPKIWPIWGGRGGGRHYMLYRAMCSMADDDGNVRASRRDLYEAANITSNSGCQRSIEFLVSAGLIEIIDSGTSDNHSGEDHKKGRSARYKVRQQGSLTPSSMTTEDSLDTYFLVLEEEGTRSGRSPLPNIDHRMDIFGDEPHLLRLIDIIIEAGADAIRATPTALSRVLGISKSSAHEMIGRLDERNMVSEGMITVESVLYYGRGWERMFRLSTRLRREIAVRVEALAGRYMPTRFRRAQAFITRPGERFRLLDFEGARRVLAAQVERGLRGEVPWLSPGELAAIRQ